MQSQGEFVPIAAASGDLNLHPQTLRKYERAGLLRPPRRAGGARLYSRGDLDRLRLIKHLADVRGINIAGMALALELRDEIAALLHEIERLEAPRIHTVARERLLLMLGKFGT